MEIGLFVLASALGIGWFRLVAVSWHVLDFPPLSAFVFSPLLWGLTTEDPMQEPATVLGITAAICLGLMLISELTAKKPS